MTPEREAEIRLFVSGSSERDLLAELDRLRIAEAETMALVLSHEGHIETQDAELDRLRGELDEAQLWWDERNWCRAEIDRLRAELVAWLRPILEFRASENKGSFETILRAIETAPPAVRAMLGDDDDTGT